MHKPFDQFAKTVVAAMLEGRVELELEHELRHPPQFIDIVFQPRPGAPADGLLGRIGAWREGLIECFSRPPAIDAVNRALYKRLALAHQWARLGRARPTARLPALWLFSPAPPRRVMEAFEAEPTTDWPPGVWRLRAERALFLVVLSELPETRATLSLRLLGRGPTLRKAIAELAAMPQRSRAYRRLTPLLVAFGRHLLQDLKQGDDTMNFLEQFRVMYSEWEQQVTERALRDGRKKWQMEGRKKGLEEGRKKGLEEALTRLVEKRFGPLPTRLRSRVRAADAKTLERWYERALSVERRADVFD